MILLTATGRKRIRTFFFEIAEIIRHADNSDNLLFAISEAVGEHLQVQRCLFNEIDLENDREIVHRDYCRGVQSVAGVHRISAYSSITSAEIAKGKTVVNQDSKIDPRTVDLYEQTYAPNGERAYIAVPLLRENRWVASLWVSDDCPRNWSAVEINLLETVAERTWLAVEKLRSEKALRESEERLRRATESAEMFSWEVDLTSRTYKYSENVEQVLGFSLPEDFAANAALIDEVDRPEALKTFERAVINMMSLRWNIVSSILQRAQKSGFVRRAWSSPICPTRPLALSELHKISPRANGRKKNYANQKNASRKPSMPVRLL